MSSNGNPRVAKIVLPILATVVVMAPLAWLWQASRVPAMYSVMSMGYLDYGGGAMPDPDGEGQGGHGQGEVHDHRLMSSRLVTDMVADPARPADVRMELVTRRQTLSVGGRFISGY